MNDHRMQIITGPGVNKKPNRARRRRRMLGQIGLLVAVGTLLGSGGMFAGAQEATPEPDGEPTIVVLVERAMHRTTVDIGEPGTSIGDVHTWGPNPLFDEANAVDTGATVQGVCTYFTEALDCLLYETIVFPDGSTLQTQGIQPSTAIPSERTIVGGSGRYLGATGTIHIEPSDDFETWTRTITFGQ